MIRERVDAEVYSPVTLSVLRLIGGIVLDEGLVPFDGGSVLVDARDLVNDVRGSNVGLRGVGFRSPNLLLVVRQQVGLQIKSWNSN